MIEVSKDYLNLMSKEIHEHNKKVGWWSKEQDCVFLKIQLASTEIAEATEGERKDLFDDKLPHRKMGEVELADCLIRLLDIGGRCEFQISNSFQQWCCDVENGTNCTLTGIREFESLNLTESSSHHSRAIKLHYLLNECLFRIFGPRSRWNETTHYPGREWENTVWLIFSVSRDLGYDIISAMEEKIKFNKDRPDHKLENREKEGGKKF